MRILKFTFFCLLIGLTSLLCTNCRKNKINTDSNSTVEFSKDTILFDTLLTTFGSTTKKFKVYNSLKQKITISNIWLEQQQQSMFRINVNGEAGVNFENITLNAEDSIFIFVEVTIDPTSGTTPFIVEDKIRFLTNGNEQQVVLNAWGQDAHFHIREEIEQSTTWQNDKPHVIYNYCQVAEGVKLTINPGTIIYSYNESILNINKGSIDCNGTVDEPIVFQQSRLEDFILSEAGDVDGQWGGIRLFEPLESSFEYVEIKNSQVGIQLENSQPGQILNLNSVRINNCSFVGLFSFSGFISAKNCLFGNTGLYSALINRGGNLTFDHCTFGNHYNSNRQTSLLTIQNFYEESKDNFIYTPFENIEFSNSLVYGLNENELQLDTLSRTINGVDAPNFKFNNSIIRTEDSIFNPDFFVSSYANKDPEFTEPQSGDFTISSSSFAKSKAQNSSVTIDIEANPRMNPASIGCYE